ncbi:MAG: hypothetical protein KGL68_01395 [Burkholderiales bacterium]|nr:hypothetical protein [Burkholderiales bacterium]
MVDRTQPDRVTFEQAVAYACSSGHAAFAATPVFGDDQERAEGLRLFIIEGDGQGGRKIRFIAGPFFSAALAANEVLADDEIPDGVREMLFLPSSFSEEWLSDPIQVLVARLVQAAEIVAPEMPNYLDAKTARSAPEVTFPIRAIGRASPRRGDDS